MIYIFDIIVYTFIFINLIITFYFLWIYEYWFWGRADSPSVGADVDIVETISLTIDDAELFVPLKLFNIGTQTNNGLEPLDELCTIIISPSTLLPLYECNDCVYILTSLT